MGTSCFFMAVLLVSLLGSGTAQADSSMNVVDPMTSPAFDGRRIDRVRRLCVFKKLPTLLLKQVDAVYEGIDSVKECRRKCLEAPFQCHSFDLGDGTNRVCRVSHHDRASLAHLKQPYSEVPGATTFEMDLCFNVTLDCGKRDMTARFSATRQFTGKIYASSRPKSCFKQVHNSFDFGLVLPYKDYECGVQEITNGKFSSNVVIQKHNMIVTSTDLDLTFNCEYDLSHKVVTNQIQLQSVAENEGETVSDAGNVGFEVIEESAIPIESSNHRGPKPGKPSARPPGEQTPPIKDKDQNKPPTHESTFHSPVVTMRITDRNGEPIRAAEVGDPLSLRFEVADPQSPHEIFVRDIIADDGVDTSELVLIDDKGCPSDIAIMGAVRKVNGNGKVIEAPFEAFKFPTSGIIQFRALIIPCLESCDPVTCDSYGFDGSHRKVSSFGRKRRRRSITELGINGTTDEEYLAVESIQIYDKFPFGDSLGLRSENGCLNLNQLALTCFVVLAIQLVLLSIWVFVWHRRRQNDRGAVDSFGSDSGSILSGISGPIKAQIIQFSNPSFSSPMVIPRHPHRPPLNNSGVISPKLVADNFGPSSLLAGGAKETSAAN